MRQILLYYLLIQGRRGIDDRFGYLFHRDAAVHRGALNPGEGFGFRKV